jgi:hypothetical protein
MSNSKKTAVDACREVSKALRANLDSLKKAESLFSPKDAALRVLPEAVNQIKVYEEELVKLRKMETAEPLGKQVTPTHQANVAQSGTPSPKGMAMPPPMGKPQKAPGDPQFDSSYNVTFATQHGTYTTRGGFGNKHQNNVGPAHGQIELHYQPNKGAIPGLPATRKLLGTFPSKEAAYSARDQHHDAKMAGIIKSEDGMSTTSPESDKEIEHKYKLSKVFDVLGKTSIMEAQRKQAAAKPNDKKLAAERNKDAVLPGDAAPKEIEASGSGGDVKKGKKLSKAEATEILEKALPRMGGKDPASKMMTSHAMAAGAKAADSGPAKIMNMPAAQLPKMPSPSMHASRAAGFADHMPPGRFGKAELMKEMEDMQKAFDSKGKFLTPDKDPKKKKPFVPGQK